MPTLELKDPLRTITIESGLPIATYDPDLVAFLNALASFSASLPFTTWNIAVQPSGRFNCDCVLKDSREEHAVLRLDLAYPAFRLLGAPGFWMRSEHELLDQVQNAVIRLIQKFAMTSVNMVWA